MHHLDIIYNVRKKVWLNFISFHNINMCAWDSPTIPNLLQLRINWNCGPEAGIRYSILVAKSNLSYPLQGAVSQNVYTDTVPLMADVLTFSPSKKGPGLHQNWAWGQFGSRSVLFRIWGQPRIKRPMVVWYGNLWICLHRAPAEGRS